MSELAERYKVAVDAFNRRDKEAWLEITHPDLVNDPPREWPEAAVIEGAETGWDFLVSNLETFEAADIELAGPIVEGDDILVAPLRADVRGKSSGIELEWAYQQVAFFRDGRIHRLAWFSDRDEALAAAGLA